MTNYKLHNDCKILSEYVYKDNKPKVINGWEYHCSLQSTNRYNINQLYQTKTNSKISTTQFLPLYGLLVLQKKERI